MTPIYEKYRACADKLEQAQFYSRTDECHRLFEGDQWYGLDTDGQRLPVYNIIQPIVEYKTAMVAQNQVSLQYSPMEYGGGTDGPREEACRMLTAYARRQWERLHMDSLVWELVRSACVSGDSYLFFYDGEGRAQVVDRANVCLADESCPDLQQQPWIILAERRDPEQLKKEAGRSWTGSGPMGSRTAWGPRRTANVSACFIWKSGLRASLLHAARGRWSTAGRA